MTMAARLMPLPWKGAERDKEVRRERRLTDVFRFDGLGSTSSTSNLSDLEQTGRRKKAKSSSGSFLSVASLPHQDFWASDTEHGSSKNHDSFVRSKPPSPGPFRREAMNSATELALAASCFTAVNGLVSSHHSPAPSFVFPSPSLAPHPYVVSAEHTPLARSPPLKPMVSPPVELPGSLLLENEGYPRSAEGSSRSRWDRDGEKLSPRTMQLLGFQHLPRMRKEMQQRRRQELEQRQRQRVQKQQSQHSEHTSVAGSQTSPVESIVSVSSLANLMSSPESPARMETPKPHILHTPRRSIDSYHDHADSGRCVESNEITADGPQAHNMEDPVQPHDNAVKDLTRKFEDLSTQQQCASITSSPDIPAKTMTDGEATLRLELFYNNESLASSSRGLAANLNALHETYQTARGDRKSSSSASSGLIRSKDVTVPSSTTAADIRNDPQFLELEKKLQDADRLCADLRFQIKMGGIRERGAAQQVEGIKEESKSHLSHVRALKREKKALSLSLESKDIEIKDLRAEMTRRDDDVNQVEERLERFIKVQREMDDRETQRNEIEREVVTLRHQLADQTATIKKLQESAHRARLSTSSGISPDLHRKVPSPPSTGGLLSPTSPDSIMTGGSNTSSVHSLSTTLVTIPSPAMRSAGTITSPVPLASAVDTKLKARVEEMSEDIRLYKLDVRGYKKDVRARDRQIKALEAKIAELEGQLGSSTASSVGQDTNEDESEGYVSGVTSVNSPNEGTPLQSPRTVDKGSGSVRPTKPEMPTEGARKEPAPIASGGDASVDSHTSNRTSVSTICPSSFQGFLSPSLLSPKGPDSSHGQDLQGLGSSRKDDEVEVGLGINHNPGISTIEPSTPEDLGQTRSSATPSSGKAESAPGLVPSLGPGMGSGSGSWTMMVPFRLSSSSTISTEKAPSPPAMSIEEESSPTLPATADAEDSPTRAKNLNLDGATA